MRHGTTTEARLTFSQTSGHWAWRIGNSAARWRQTRKFWVSGGRAPARPRFQKWPPQSGRFQEALEDTPGWQNSISELLADQVKVQIQGHAVRLWV